MRAVTDIGNRASERDMLNGFLDWYRAVVVNKATGVNRADATRVMTPTGLSVLGVVKHLALVELGWFDEVFAGNPERTDPHGEFQIAGNDTVASIIEMYEAACQLSRKHCAAAASLDQLSAVEDGMYGRASLRWILVHMIEETARHAGHLDLMREQIDGTTGD